MVVKRRAPRCLTIAWTVSILLTAVFCGPAVGQNDKDLTYPEAAMRAGIQGAVVLQVDFDERGRATSSTALSGLPALTAHSLANLGVWGTGWRSTRQILVYEYRIEQGLCHDDSQTLTLHRLPGLVSVIACRRVDADTPPVRAAAATQTGGEERFKVLRFEDIHYSLPAAATLRRGVVVVEVTFDEKGSATSAAARSGPEDLRAAAVENARRWRFAANPDRKAILVYEFSIDAGACDNSLRSVFLLRHPNFAATIHCTPIVQTR